MVLGNWTATCKRMKLEHFLIPYTKVNSKWIKDLNVRPETIKFLDRNINRTLDDINQNKILYDPPPRIMEIKTKVNKWDLINLKILHSKGNVKQGEKTTLRMGEIIANETTDKRINFQNIQAAYTMPEKQITQSKSGKKT